MASSVDEGSVEYSKNGWIKKIILMSIQKRMMQGLVVIIILNTHYSPWDVRTPLLLKVVVDA